MLTIVGIMSLAVSCNGDAPSSHTHGSDLLELLNVVSRDNLKTELDDDDDADFQVPDNPHLNNSLFCAIGESRQTGAEEAREEDFPWVARIVHSRRATGPLICTAAAIREAVFVTAGRCIATSKCVYISIIYQKINMKCDAFVFPKVFTKQWFDDFGLVTTNFYRSEWQLLARQPAKRPLVEDGFAWFDEWNLYEPTNTVVGYVADPQKPSEHKLYLLRRVYASNSLCNSIMRNQRRSNDYYVPCYHPCTAKQHFAGNAACDRHLAGLGHVVLDQKQLPVGIATWTCRNDPKVSKRPLPVGIAVPNSEALGEQLTCSVRIEEERARGREAFIGLC